MYDNGDGSVTVDQMLLDYQRLTQELAPFRPSLFVQGATTSDVPEPVLAAYDAPFPDDSYAVGPRRLPALMGTTPRSECARINRHSVDALRTSGIPLLTAFSDGDPGTAGWAEVLTEWIPGAAGQRSRDHCRSRALPPGGPRPRSWPTSWPSSREATD